MRFTRQSGVFLHHTSVPGPHGIGDLGNGSRQFVDFLEQAGQSLWQCCPLGPTATVHGHSPYQAYSAFAGNPLLIDLHGLAEDGLLTEDDLEAPDSFSPHEVHYEAVSAFKTERLERAAERFETDASADDRDAFEAFCEREAGWLPDYALFMALKDEFDGAWTDWPQELKAREADALESYREELAAEVRYHELTQWWFDRQWRALQAYASERGVQLVGDLPIYVAADSADVWAAPEAFQLTDDNEPAAVAGVPPNPGDDGQRWGNPVYDWEQLQANGYEWWIARLRRLFDLVDITRIDHFKGFDEYYAIPAHSDNPADGQWHDAPGYDFFETVEAELGELPFVVEDLGFLDHSLISLRDHFDFPGMRVPHYADWCAEGNEHQPMHYPENVIGYTSTHDTDTAVGYYRDLPDHQRDCLHFNLGADGSDIHWELIEGVWNANAVLAVTTMPDLLGLGSEARFNTPGTAHGNWGWRVTEDGLDDGIAGKLRGLTAATMR